MGKRPTQLEKEPAQAGRRPIQLTQLEKSGMPTIRTSDGHVRTAALSHSRSQDSKVITSPWRATRLLARYQDIEPNHS